MSKTATMNEYTERLREWQCAVVEWMGWDPEQVYQLDDYIDGGWHRLDWRALERQSSPRRGYEVPLSFQSDHVDGIRFQGGARFHDPAEWDELIAAVGEKPRLITRDQELILKGLAYKREVEGR